MKKIVIEKTRANFTKQPFFLGILALVILLAAFGWQTSDTRTSARTKQTTAPPMPNLDGKKAKQYLEKQGLDKSLGEAIQAERYSVNWVEHAPISNGSGAFEAKNSQQKFTAYFSNDGVNLVSGEEGKKWDFSLKLKGYGRGEQLETLSSGEIKTEGNRVEISKSKIQNSKAKIVEWFENKPEGLEQGFVINESPIKDGRETTDDKLKIVLNLSGDLQARAAIDGHSLSLVNKSGASVLSYDKLKSWDANGKELASRMEFDGNELSLVVDDAEAVYPITIDPTFTQVKKLVASNSAPNDAFGWAVAVSGNTAVVSAIYHNSGQNFGGAVYIFERNTGGANNWSEIKELTRLNGELGEYFGYSVAIENDTVIVGAPDKNQYSNAAGAIYIFERNTGGANNWGQVRRKTPSDGSFKDDFGNSVAIDGDTLIVGAPDGYDGITPTIKPGAAYIFERNASGANNWGEIKKIAAEDASIGDKFGWDVSISGDTAIISKFSLPAAAYIVERDAGGVDNWGQIKKLTASDGPGGIFGISAAIDGDTAIVGAYGRNVGGNIAQGAAYIYERNTGGADNWGEVKRLVASDGAEEDLFGASVDVSGDKIAVGAYNDDIGANLDQGSAYTFERNAGGANNWGEVKKLVAANGIASDFFGSALALDGNTVIVGAFGMAEPPNDGRGSAFVFVRTNDSWVQDVKSLPANCTVEDYFGGAVAISGDTAIVGATLDDVGSNANQGAAYIFERSGNSWSLVKTIAAADGAADDFFGSSVAINGNTAIVGVYTDDTGTNINQGAAYIFERNAGGTNNWGQIKKLTASDGADGDWFGWSVGISGDAIIVGAILDDVGANNLQGSAYIYERNAGGANNWGEVKHVIASDGAAFDQFGKSVAVSGDTAIVGSDLDDVGANGNQGSVYLFERNNGGAGNWGELRKITASDGAATDQFGVGVAISGNTIIVGAWQDDVGTNNNQGSAYIFERNVGGANNWGEVKKLVASDGTPSENFGLSVDISGEMVIVGLSRDQIGANSNQGSAYIFRQNAGGANNWGEVRKITAADGAAGDQFGNDVAISGETAIVGASGDDIGGAANQGSARIFVSNNDIWNEQALISPPPPTNCGANDDYGTAVAISGDTAVIGAQSDDVGINANQGSVYILERNAGGANNWGTVKLLTASDGGADEFFGVSVAISGNKVIVGASNDTIGTNTQQGSAYIFERNTGGANNWGEVKKLVALDGAEDDLFGNAVSISNNTAIVGAIYRDNGGSDQQGAAYIFEQNAGGANNWGQVRKIVATDGAAEDWFGNSVGISGDTVIIGAARDNISASDEGSAYIFERNTGGANNWGEVRKLTATDGAAGDQFGNSVAVSGNTAIVGAYQDDTGANNSQGSAYIFERNTGGANNWGQIKKLVAADGATGDFFGNSVSISGDAAIVGSPFHDVGANANQGLAYIFQQNAGGADNWGQVNKLMANDGSAGDFFGYAVAVSGDNFLVGAYLANATAPFKEKQSDNLFGGTQQGAGYIFRGDVLAPTAASVSIGGRVLTATGRGIANARVTLTEETGASRTAISNPFGYYRFANVEAGRSYVISVRHKQHQFTTRVLTVNEDLGEENFIAEQLFRY